MDRRKFLKQIASGGISGYIERERNAQIERVRQERAERDRREREDRKRKEAERKRKEKEEEEERKRKEEERKRKEREEAQEKARKEQQAREQLNKQQLGRSDSSKTPQRPAKTSSIQQQRKDSAQTGAGSVSGSRSLTQAANNGSRALLLGRGREADNRGTSSTQQKATQKEESGNWFTRTLKTIDNWFSKSNPDYAKSGNARSYYERNKLQPALAPKQEPSAEQRLKYIDTLESTLSNARKNKLKDWIPSSHNSNDPWYRQALQYGHDLVGAAINLPVDAMNFVAGQTDWQMDALQKRINDEKYKLYRGNGDEAKSVLEKQGEAARKTGTGALENKIIPNNWQSVQNYQPLSGTIDLQQKADQVRAASELANKRLEDYRRLTGSDPQSVQAGRFDFNQAAQLMDALTSQNEAEAEKWKNWASKNYGIGNWWDDAQSKFLQNMNDMQAQAYSGLNVRNTEDLMRVKNYIAYLDAQDELKELDIKEKALLTSNEINPYWNHDGSINKSGRDNELKRIADRRLQLYGMIQKNKKDYDYVDDMLPSNSAEKAWGWAKDKMMNLSNYIDDNKVWGLDSSYQESLVDQASALRYQLNGLRDASNASERAAIYNKFSKASEAQRKYWTDAYTENMKDLQRHKADHDVSEYFNFKERTTKGGLFDGDMWLYTQPGQMGSSSGSWIKQTASMAGNIAAAYFTRGRSLLTSTLVKGAAFGANMVLGISQGVTENSTEVNEAYKDRLSENLKHDGKYEAFVADGRKKLGNLAKGKTDDEIIALHAAGFYNPSPRFNGDILNSVVGSNALFQDDMMAVTADTAVDGLLEVNTFGGSVGKAKALRNAVGKAATAEEIAGTGLWQAAKDKTVLYGSKVASFIGSFGEGRLSDAAGIISPILKPVVGAAKKGTRAAVKATLGEEGTAAIAKSIGRKIDQVSKFARSVPYSALGPEKYKKASRLFRQSIPQRILGPESYMQYHTLKDAGKYLAKNMFVSGYSEGIEEAKQYMHSAEFKAGMYDDQNDNILSARRFIDDITDGAVGAYVSLGVPFNLNLCPDFKLYNKDEMYENVKGGFIGGLLHTGSVNVATSTPEVVQQMRMNDFVAQNIMAQKEADRNTYLQAKVYAKKAVGGENSRRRMNQAFDMFKDINEKKRAAGKDYIAAKTVDAQRDIANNTVQLATLLTDTAKKVGIDPTSEKYTGYVGAYALAMHKKDESSDNVEQRINNLEKQVREATKQIYSIDDETGEVINNVIYDLTGDKMRSIVKRKDGEDTAEDTLSRLNIGKQNDVAVITKMAALKEMIEDINKTVNDPLHTGRSRRDVKFLQKRLQTMLDQVTLSVKDDVKDKILANPRSYLAGVSDVDGLVDSMRQYVYAQVEDDYNQSIIEGLSGKYMQDEKDPKAPFSKFNASDYVDGIEKTIEEDIQLQEDIQQDWDNQFADRQTEALEVEKNKAFQERLEKTEKTAKASDYIQVQHAENFDHKNDDAVFKEMRSVANKGKKLKSFGQFKQMLSKKGISISKHQIPRLKKLYEAFKKGKINDKQFASVFVSKENRARLGLKDFNLDETGKPIARRETKKQRSKRKQLKKGKKKVKALKEEKSTEKETVELTTQPVTTKQPETPAEETPEFDFTDEEMDEMVDQVTSMYSNVPNFVEIPAPETDDAAVQAAADMATAELPEAQAQTWNKLQEFYEAHKDDEVIVTGHDRFVREDGKLVRYTRVHGVMPEQYKRSDNEEKEALEVYTRLQDIEDTDKLIAEIRRLAKEHKDKYPFMQDINVDVYEEYLKQGIDSKERYEVLLALSNMVVQRPLGPSVVVGQYNDDICRAYFSEDDISIEYETFELFDGKTISEVMPRDTFDKLMRELAGIKQMYDDLGWKLSTRPYNLTSTFIDNSLHEEVRISGETDMIGVDKDGHIHIIDFKTSVSLFYPKNGEIEGDYESNESYPGSRKQFSSRLAHSNQLTYYKIMFEDNVPVIVESAEVLGFNVSYNSSYSSTAGTRVLTGEQPVTRISNYAPVVDEHHKWIIQDGKAVMAPYRTMLQFVDSIGSRYLSTDGTQYVNDTYTLHTQLSQQFKDTVDKFRKELELVEENLTAVQRSQIDDIMSQIESALGIVDYEAPSTVSEAYVLSGFNKSIQQTIDRINSTIESFDEVQPEETPQEPDTHRDTPINNEDYEDAMTDRMEMFVTDLRATFKAKYNRARDLYNLGTSRTQVQSDELVLIMYDLSTMLEMYDDVTLGDQVAQLAKGFIEYYLQHPEEFDGTYKPQQPNVPTPPVQRPQSGSRTYGLDRTSVLYPNSSFTYKASIESSVDKNHVGSTDPKHMLSHYTGEPEFATQAKFELILDNNMVKLVITYKGRTFTPVDMNLSEAQRENVYNMLVQARREGKHLMVTGIRRTSGRMHEADVEQSPLENGIVLQDQLYEIEYTENQNTFGVTKPVTVGNKTSVHVMRPQGTGKTSLYEFNNNTAAPEGVIVMMVTRDYPEEPNHPKVPCYFRRKKMSEGDAKMIAEILRMKHLNPGSLNQMTLQQSLNELYFDGPVGKILTNYQVLSMLIQVGKNPSRPGNVYLEIDQDNANRIHIFGRLEGEEETVNSDYDHPFDLSTDAGINDFVQFLLDKVYKDLSEDFMCSRLGSANYPNSPINGFANRADSLLKNGSVQFGESSLIFDQSDFKNPSDQRDAEGLSGLAWIIKRGQVTTTFDGFENVLLNTNSASFLLEDEVTSDENKAEPENMPIDTNPEPIISGGEMISDELDGLFKTQLKSSGNRISKVSVEKNLRRILGNKNYSIIVKDILVQGRPDIVGLCQAAVIALSTNAESGVEFHEAFHRIMELVLPKDQRMYFYNKYMNRHKKLIAKHFGISRSQVKLSDRNIYKYVQEGIADEFMMYANQTPTSFIDSKAKSLWSRIKDFARAWKAAGLFNYRLARLYSDVQLGRYAEKSENVTSEQMQEFVKENHDGLAFNLKGRELPSILNDQVYRDAKKSFVFYMLEDLKDRINPYGTNFVDVINDVVKDPDTFKNFAWGAITKQVKKGTISVNGKGAQMSEYSKEILRDILRNWDICAEDLISEISSFATKSKDQQVEDEKNQDNNPNAEQHAEEVEGLGESNRMDDHTKSSYEFSPFDSTTQQVKFFFARIAQQSSSEENGVMVSRLFVNTSGMPQFRDAKELYSETLNEFNDVTDGADFLRRLAEAAQKDVKWFILYKKFETLYKQVMNPDTYDADSEGLLTQIVCSIRKNRQNIAMSRFSPAKSDPSMFAHDIFNMGKETNAMQHVRNWSMMFADGGSAWITRDESGNVVMKNGISPSIFYALAEEFDNIKKFVSPLQNKPDLYYKNENVKIKLDVTNPQHISLLIEKLSRLLNSLGINIDTAVLKYMFDHQPGCDSTLSGMNMMFSHEQYGLSSLVSQLNPLCYKGKLNIDSDGNIPVPTRTSTKLVPVNQIFNNNGFVKELANWKEEYLRSTTELSELAAGGVRKYMISENNHISDMVHELNKQQSNIIDEFTQDSYVYWDPSIEDTDSQTASSEPIGSILIKNHKSKHPSKLDLVLYDGSKTRELGDVGTQYDEMSDREDYVSKLALLDNGNICFPTMSDKKTWVYIRGVALPGIDYNTRDTITKFFSTLPMQVVNGKLVFTEGGASVAKQLREYALCEHKSINELLLKYNSISEAERVTNHHISTVYIKNGKVVSKDTPGAEKHNVVQGARYRFLQGVKDENGDLIDFNCLIDENGNYIDEQRLMQRAQENFFALREGETETSMVERQYQQLALIIQDRVMDELATAEKLGLIKRDPNTGYYVNVGLDNDKIEAISKNTIIGDLTNIRSEELGRLKQEAIMIYMSNVVCRQIMSINEVERVFSGDSSFFKWKYNEDGKLVDMTTDMFKRLGGLVSTGTNNNTSISGIAPDACYTVCEVNNDEVSSPQYEEIEKLFTESELRTALILQELTKNMSWFDSDKTAQDITESVNSMTLDQVRESLDSDTLKIVEKKIASKVSKFKKGIDVADGGAYMSARMCKNLLRMVGSWNNDIAEAFKILEGEKVADVLQVAEAYQKVVTTVIGNQKYTAYGFRHQNGKQVPYYNKMALFPVFKITSTGRMAQLYRKMQGTKEDGSDGIDMIMINSAVKVGSQGSVDADFESYADHDGDSRPDYSTKQFNVYRQRYSYLRKQFNTDPHGELVRDLGTQMTKLAMQALLPGLIYTDQDGKAISATELRDRINDHIKSLSSIGKQLVIDEFYRDGKFDVLKFSKFMKEELSGRGASNEQLQGLSTQQFEDEEGNTVDRLSVPLYAQSNMNWLLSIIVARVNDRVCDIETPGAAFIQRSVWGMEGTTYVVGDDDLPRSINGGKKLLQINEEGSMDCVLSIDFYLDVLKKARKKTGRKIKKKVKDVKYVNSNGDDVTKQDIWEHIYRTHLDIYEALLHARSISNNPNQPIRNLWGKTPNTDPEIIGKSLEDFWAAAVKQMNLTSKEVEVEREVDEYVSYDKLSFEEQRQFLIDNKIIGGTAEIVAARIPTQSTSSIHALRCVDVLPVVRDTVILPEAFTKVTGSDFDIDKLYLATINYRMENGVLVRDFEEGSEEYHQNGLINSYLTILKDTRSAGVQHSSIDDDTQPFLDIVDDLEQGSEQDRIGVFSLYSVTKNVETKSLFVAGKNGIGPFALNNNSHILTTLYGVSFDSNKNKALQYLSKLTKYDYLSLHNVSDVDGGSIMSLLSGLINGHVDNAKNPWPSKLNINQYTYSLIAMMVRTGFGKSTFYFTTQPILKQLAKASQNANGKYMMDPYKSKYALQKEAELAIVTQYVQSYRDSIDDNADISTYDRAVDYMNQKVCEKLKIKDNLNAGARMAALLFAYNKDLLRKVAKGHVGDVTFKIGKENIEMPMEMFQYIVYQSKLAFDPSAQALSDLVKYSKIDTKSHGKSLVEHEAYLSGFESTFGVRRNPNGGFINDVRNTSCMFDRTSVLHMINSSFIAQKTDDATSVYKQIMSEVSLEGTDVFIQNVHLIMNVIGKSSQFDPVLAKKVSNMLNIAIKMKYINRYASANGINIHDLIDGGDTLYDKICRLKCEIAYSEKYRDLRDSDGSPKNYALKMLNPGRTFDFDKLTKLPGEDFDTYKNPKFVQLLSFTSKDNINEDDFVAGWRELFENEAHPELQQLARELIVYAYVTGGEIGGHRDLTKYVPNAWKMGMYDLDNEDVGSYIEYMLGVYNDAKDGRFRLTEQDIDDIILNNWDDYKFIPVLKPEENGVMQFEQHFAKNDKSVLNYGQLLLAIRSDQKPTFEITGDPLFIKVKRPGKHAKYSQREYTVYKRIDTITRNNVTFPVYVQVDPKGGSYAEGNHIYEFGRNDNSTSEANKDVAMDSVIGYIRNILTGVFEVEGVENNNNPIDVISQYVHIIMNIRNQKIAKQFAENLNSRMTGADDVMWSILHDLGYSYQGLMSKFDEDGNYIVNDEQELDEMMKQGTVSVPSSVIDPRFDSSQISDKTEDYGVEIDTDLKQNHAQWQMEHITDIVAYRVNFSVYNTPTEAAAGRIGNPFSERDNRGKETVDKFFQWLVTGENFGNSKATAEYRDAIIARLKMNPEAKVLYFRELGYPSHATVLGYLARHPELIGGSLVPKSWIKPFVPESMEQPQQPAISNTEQSDTSTSQSDHEQLGLTERQQDVHDRKTVSQYAAGVLNNTLKREESFNKLMLISDQQIRYLMGHQLTMAKYTDIENAVENTVNIVNYLKQNNVNYGDVIKAIAINYAKEVGLSLTTLELLDVLRQMYDQAVSEISDDNVKDSAFLPYWKYKKYEELLDRTIEPTADTEYDERRKGYPVKPMVAKFVDKIINMFGEVEDYEVMNNIGYIIELDGSIIPNQNAITIANMFSGNENVTQQQLQNVTQQPASEDKTISYNLPGQKPQTYTIKGSHIYNSKGTEVFKEDSKHRRKIFANLAVKEGRAVVVEHNGKKYVVNNRDQIISVTSGNEMKWGDENGDRKAILDLAKSKFQSKQGSNTSKSSLAVFSSEEIAQGAKIKKQCKG